MTRKAPLEVLQGDLADHPAVRAWASIRPTRLPGTIDVLRQRRTSFIYRLHGVGDGGRAVIAKRIKSDKAGIERTVYEAILPRLPLTSPEFYGSTGDDEGMCWIFLEDVGGDRYSAESAPDRAIAGRWVGILHACTAQDEIAARSASRLPPGGPERYLAHLRAGRAVLLKTLVHGAMTPAEAARVDALVGLLQRLEARWMFIEEACDGLPATIVHGDFRPKNAYVRRVGSRADLFVIDWETAGWGIPAADLTRVDLEAYETVIRDRWRAADPRAIERLAAIGQVFKSLAAINWETASLGDGARSLLERPLASLAVLQRDLGAAAHAAGM